MEINFTIPDKYVDKIKEAFKVTTKEEFKEKVKKFVVNTYIGFLINKATSEIVIEEDLIS